MKGYRKSIRVICVGLTLVVLTLLNELAYAKDVNPVGRQPQSTKAKTGEFEFYGKMVQQVVNLHIVPSPYPGRDPFELGMPTATCKSSGTQYPAVPDGAGGWMVKVPACQPVHIHVPVKYGARALKVWAPHLSDYDKDHHFAVVTGPGGKVNWQRNETLQIGEIPM